MTLLVNFLENILQYLGEWFMLMGLLLLAGPNSCFSNIKIIIVLIPHQCALPMSTGGHWFGDYFSSMNFSRKEILISHLLFMQLF